LGGERGAKAGTPFAHGLRAAFVGVTADLKFHREAHHFFRHYGRAKEMSGVLGNLQYPKGRSDFVVLNSLVPQGAGLATPPGPPLLSGAKPDTPNIFQNTH
jgi:hypothetical protein